MSNKDKNPIYTWEYNEEPPMAALLQQARDYPNFKVWQLLHGGTFTAVTFAKTKKVAQKRFREFSELDEVEEVFKYA